MALRLRGAAHHGVTRSRSNGGSAGFGGDIYTLGGMLKITNSTISGNSAGFGSGISTAHLL
jgi:hypothetical protein